MNHHPQGAGRSPRPLLPYGISTFTLKNRWAAFVGHTHAASVRFVLPRTVYTRLSRGGIEDAAECAGFVETARPLGSFVDVFVCFARGTSAAKIERRTLEILVSTEVPLRTFDGTRI